MIKNLAAAIALTVGVAAAPAAAVTYDAFSSFDGTQGAGNFTYGGFDGTNFTAFTATSGCTSFISDTICLNDGSLPAAFKTTTGAHESGSVNVPGDRLILHPGEFTSAAYVEFTATVAGSYLLFADFSVQDDSPSGVNLFFFYRIAGVTQFIDPIGSLASVGDNFPYFNAGPLGIGDSVGIIVDKGQVYFNDSTGVNLTLTTVPEPATWGLMIVGFGLVGMGLRRKAALAA